MDGSESNVKSIKIVNVYIFMMLDKFPPPPPPLKKKKKCYN